MKHVAPGRLRRALDEPATLDARSRAHVRRCALCRSVSDDLATAADRVARAFATTPGPGAALDLAAARIANRLGDHPAATPLARLRRPAAAASLATAAAAVVALASSPVRSVAHTFLSVFAPSAVAPIALDPHDVATLRSLPGLAAYGTIRSREDALVYSVPDARQASLAAAFPVHVPAYVPALAPSVPRYVVSGKSVTDFTFSAVAASRSAAAAGSFLPPMPAGLDGSTLEAGFGPSVVTTYASPSEPAVTPANVVALATETGEAPTLAIVELPVPKIDSTGASAGAIETYLLSQPGMSPHLATQLAALGDLTTTLPIPIPLDRAFARPALVRGRPGVTFGDETGSFAGAVWQEDGMLYAVYGRLPLHEIAAVANSLH